MKIAHVITGLSTGGAEMMLVRLVKQQHQQGIQAIVFSLVSDGELKSSLTLSGIEVIDLNFPRGWISVKGFFHLLTKLRDEKPDLVMCWMYHANLIGGLAARLTGLTPIVWSIHNSTLDFQKSSKLTIWIMKLGAVFSFLPAAIITCSDNSRTIHEQAGYRRDKFVVIPNGFDTTIFHPDPEAGDQLKKYLGISDSKKIVGFIGRYDPQKDLPTFIQTAKLVVQEDQNVEFILCGQGLAEENQELMKMIMQAAILDKVHLLGRKSEIEQVHQALDILVSSSAYGEAFSMVIGEAMACGVPCVATDIGDARFLIADTGTVVPPKNPQALASAVINLLSMSDEVMNQKKTQASKRIHDHFALPVIAEQYTQVFHKLITP